MIFHTFDYDYETQTCGSIMMEDLAGSATNATIFDSLTFKQVRGTAFFYFHA